VSYAEIAAWAWLTGRKPRPDEVRTLMLFNIVRNRKNKSPVEQHRDNYAPSDNAEAMSLAMKWAADDAAKRNKAKAEAAAAKKKTPKKESPKHG
jgi:hypothetical protein